MTIGLSDRDSSPTPSLQGLGRTVHPSFPGVLPETPYTTIIVRRTGPQWVVGPSLTPPGGSHRSPRESVLTDYLRTRRQDETPFTCPLYRRVRGARTNREFGDQGVVERVDGVSLFGRPTSHSRPDDLPPTTGLTTFTPTSSPQSSILTSPATELSLVPSVNPEGRGTRGGLTPST